MLRQFLLSLAYSNLWIALSAGAQVWVHFLLLDSPVVWEPCLLATGSMFWVYTFAKAVHFDPAADALNDPERTKFLQRYRLPLISWGLATIVACCYRAGQYSLTALGLVLLPIFAGLLYDLRLLPNSFRYRRLKDITGVKGLIVAGAWATLTLGLPLEYGASASVLTTIGVFVWSFLQWFINTTYFDLGDVVGDAEEGTQTIPVRFGFQQTKMLLHILNVAAFVLFSTLWYTERIPSSCLPVCLASAHNLVILLRARDGDSDISLECDVVADGLFVWMVLYFLLGRICDLTFG